MQHAAPLMPSNNPFTFQELQTVSRTRNTSLGADSISYSMLHAAGQPFRTELLHLYKSSFAAGTFSTTWRHTTLVSILRPLQSAQYRPISPPSFHEKTTERMVLTRFQCVDGLLYDHLFASRRYTGTLSCLTTLFSHVLGKKAFMIFLD